MNEQDIQLFKSWQDSPINFIKSMWGLEPQRAKAGVENPFLLEHFEKFEKGKHITWQQVLMLEAVEKAVNHKDKQRITCRSGHGVGKTAVLSWLVLWYLLCFKNSQVPCTAPTELLIKDVLWKEISVWLRRMPQEMQDFYIYTSGYIRIKEAPDAWFARARTARKEKPEALAGIHGDFVMYVVDEASGVPEEIYKTAEGALTGENVLVVLISNPTRLNGYFHDTHTSDKEAWQTLHFNSEQSPVVDQKFVDRILSKYGEGDEYAIRVKGDFPKEDSIDTKGYVPLLVQSDIKYTDDNEFIRAGWKKMGIDPSGEGTDETVWVIRNPFKAKIIAREKISNSKSIAQKTLTLMDYFNISDRDVFIDNFGVGANVAQELWLVKKKVRAINVGDSPDDKDIFLNKRAESFYRLKEWVRKGAELVRQEGWDELLNIRYRRELSGRMKIMSKREMRQEGYASPNIADALMLTFYNKDSSRPVDYDAEKEFRDMLNKKRKGKQPLDRVATTWY